MSGPVASLKLATLSTLEGSCRLYLLVVRIDIFPHCINCNGGLLSLFGCQRDFFSWLIRIKKKQRDPNIFQMPLFFLERILNRLVLNEF